MVGVWTVSNLNIEIKDKIYQIFTVHLIDEIKLLREF